jgi:KRAB domain-containing zinc finger protein
MLHLSTRTAHRSAIKKHLRTHETDVLKRKPYACELCGYRSGDRSNLKSHMRIHTGEKPYACSVCTYRSNEKGNLTKHQRTHTGEKPFACPHCDYRATQRFNLIAHMGKHGDGDKPYTCERCSFRCRTRVSFPRLLVSETSASPAAQLPLATAQANAANSPLQSELGTHAVIHKDAMPYACELCDYRAVHKGHVTRHMATHTEERQAGHVVSAFAL